MFDRFTDRARRVMGFARQEAQRLNHEYIGTEHFLLGLALEKTGVAERALTELGLDEQRLRAEVMKLVQRGTTALTLAQLPFTPGAKQALEGALSEGQRLQMNYVGTEHLLLGLTMVEEGVAYQVFRNCDVPPEDLRDRVLALLGRSDLAVEKVREPASDVLAAWNIRWGGGAPEIEDVTESVRAANEAAGVIEQLAEGNRDPRLIRKARSLASTLRGHEPCGACVGSGSVRMCGQGAAGHLVEWAVPCPDCTPDSGTRWVRFRYRNYKGKTAVRRAVPGAIWWGATEWHQETQWLFRAWDLDKGASRDYALRDVLAWAVERCRACDGTGEIRCAPAGEEPTPGQCGVCRGTGWADHGAGKDFEPTCGRCGGSGWVARDEQCPDCNPRPQAPPKCSRCGGAGWLDRDEQCPECNPRRGS